jgi:hypothetical protein
MDEPIDITRYGDIRQRWLDPKTGEITEGELMVDLYPVKTVGDVVREEAADSQQAASRVSHSSRSAR